MNISSVAMNAYERLSTGSSINKAADNPAGLSIAQQMKSQTTAMDQNVANVGSMNDLTKTAESSLGQISDHLNRIQELAIQASSGIMTEDDKSIIQGEVDQLLSSITDIAKNTEFNGMKLLDGSFTNKNTAMNIDGTGNQISIESTALDNLGIAGFDVTGKVDLTALQGAMDKVSSSRANLGSASNAFEYASNNITNTRNNLTSAQSQIGDTDMAKEISNLKKEQILQQYQMYTQQLKAERQRSELGVMTGQDFRV